MDTSRDTAKRTSAEASTQVGDDEEITTGVKRLRKTCVTELTDVLMRKLASELGQEWKPLATLLGFSDAQIYRLESDNPHQTEEQMFRMLVQWRQQSPLTPYAQVKTLSSHLREVGREHQADYLSGIHQGDGAKKLQGFAETMSCDKHQYKKEFYCETCQELICRFCSLRDDHESHHYVTVKEASAKFKHDLNDTLQLLNTDLVKIDQNLMSISQAEKTFSSRVTEALGVVQDRAAREIEEVKAEENRVIGELKQREKENGQTLDEKRKRLLELQKQKLHTLAVAKAAYQEDLSSIFFVRYTDIRKQLQKLGSERPPKSDAKLVYPTFQRSQNIGAVDLGKVVMEDTWELCHEFGKQGQGVGEFEAARGVAAAAEPDEIAVTDWQNRRFVICNNQGRIKGYISGHSDDVTIMPDGWVVASQRDVKVYTRDMTLAYEFKTVAESEVGKTEVRLVSVTVMQNGDIIAGDIKRKVLMQHQSAKGGKLIRTIPVSIRPDFLAVLSNGRIVISDYEEGLAGIVDVSDGKAAEVATIRPTIGGKPVKRCAGVCSNSSGIYLVVNTAYINNGHVHHYDDLGQFVSCVAQGLYNPTGIAFTADGQQLAVADLHSVKIYHKV